MQKIKPKIKAIGEKDKLNNIFFRSVLLLTLSINKYSANVKNTKAIQVQTIHIDNKSLSIYSPSFGSSGGSGV